ncbi:FkbM family methyltransferase [Niveispirillum sp. SYP-B3756]|uniref:FkbM family methyltransferase n=1 Tax=Niveispirillum sp. SYP-B3756 TaxID=2662178 RepID=UPI001291F134|nr:FkbM family methyltransferase [Niveispirillum sp. SYP-B3756]MQP68441.1 FkbM family methyltransferase [Niveispirillum sp. SYP-B3756]
MLRLFYQFLKALRLCRTARFRQALRFGIGAADQHVPVLRALAPSPSLIVDVGANRGQFLLAALQACPQARLIAIEPQPSACDRIRLMLSRLHNDRDRVTVVATALSDQEGEARLHVARRDDNSSLRPPTAAQTRLFRGTDTPHEIRVPLTRLDQLLSPQDVPSDALLKIDVQGSEGEVLLGAAGVLSRFRYVYVECSQIELYEGQQLADAITALLAAGGFRLQGRYNRIFDADGQDIQADHLFVRATDS